MMLFSRIASGGIPRGLSRTGPAILSYGFRPFFLLAGCWAVLAMTLWVVALTLGSSIGGRYGPVNWHAHEMVFGYTTAVLAGFMLTAIPNWTGRLPVSGAPLLVLVIVWLAGRTTLLAPDSIGLVPTILIEAAFLPLLTLIALREIVAGRNWKNLKILFALLALTIANCWFHAAVLGSYDTGQALRLGVSAWGVLIALIGGRIIPSFTRNWLARHNAGKLPQPFGRFDQACLVAMVVALGVWVARPDGLPTAVLCFLAGALQLVRLVRWRGWATLREPIVFVLHIAYGFLAVGLWAIGLAAYRAMTLPSAIHILLIGAIGGMTLAVMSRASLGHTGRAIRASTLTVLAYIYLFAAALIRPLVDIAPDFYYPLFAVSGILWILSFGTFTLVYLPILASPRQISGGAQ